MSILKAPPKQPKTVTVQARVEESVKTQLERYAEFIDASPSYVITEALKLLFRKDDDFRRWADQHANKHNNGEAKGDVLRKPSSKHETSSNSIRRARERSVPQTACLAPFSKPVAIRVQSKLTM